ncbi:RanGTP-binding protein-domain-containing protein [Microdochium trichocladiopsis]|uniref:RanGTP-binding protein-domain-containing protein n=1 Tax=Microdochium trichocladiopsis TaxID=1682393 RepID=A0A9P8XXS3_9PEZI|nr:RanGTP-binding protein-domain-containing protein [Microdochium trichocladiopsis]KAH7020955.1 RanGTP-binding protein-domain-containing protein [Microdochium trichocladiopsis]
MDAFVSKLSYHATSFAIRSCLALTSNYVAKHAGSLLKTVDNGPLRRELDKLQRRLARKIELLSPILESIELRYAQGETALETVIQTSQDLRREIDCLEARIMLAQPENQGDRSTAKVTSNSDAGEVLAIIDDIKDLITNIDDAIPLVNLWISSLGTTPTQTTPFSPSRLLQASMLLNIADTQHVLNSSGSTQIGPDFYVSLYMLFRGHASLRDDEEPYGVGEGQRKPLWQQVMRKARVRLYRMSHHTGHGTQQESRTAPETSYEYQLRIVEDLDDGLLHTSDGRTPVSASYDGVIAAGMQQALPIGQVSKLLYTEVGGLLNIVPDDDQRGNPVLLLKREVGVTITSENLVKREPDQEIRSRPDFHIPSGDEGVQGEINRQLFGEDDAAEHTSVGCNKNARLAESGIANGALWQLPPNLDPEWLALEVYTPEDDEGCGSDTSSQTIDDPQQIQNSISEDAEQIRSDSCGRTSDYTDTFRVDANLCKQFSRMSTGPVEQLPSFHVKQGFESSSTDTFHRPNGRSSPVPSQLAQSSITDKSSLHDEHNTRRERDRTLLQRSPFGAITTSLSLLEMLLRLTSLQEFEQKTHLAIPDHLLRFYLDESASTSGLRGQQRVSARREAEAKMGFDPYTDSPAFDGR